MVDKIPYVTAVELEDAHLRIAPSRIWEMRESDRRCIAGKHHWMPVRGEDQPPDMILLECKHCGVKKEADPEDEY